MSSRTSAASGASRCKRRVAALAMRWHAAAARRTLCARIHGQAPGRRPGAFPRGAGRVYCHGNRNCAADRAALPSPQSGSARRLLRTQALARRCSCLLQSCAHAARARQERANGSRGQYARARVAAHPQLDGYHRTTCASTRVRISTEYTVPTTRASFDARALLCDATYDAALSAAPPPADPYIRRPGFILHAPPFVMRRWTAGRSQSRSRPQTSKPGFCVVFVGCRCYTLFILH
jgi:hypothetical protein